MSTLHPVPVLHGRRGERETLDRLLAEVRADRSQVLVLRGEAGVGKTALLEYLAETAAGCHLARTIGVESEMELPFAGVQQLCAQMLHRLPHLPALQQDALNTAFGRSSGPTPDRFLVGLAVLSLLSDVAGDGPVVCLVDDAQWLDQASAQVLAFVARRLLAEAVGLVFAVRVPADRPELEGLPVLTVPGLGDSDARALLRSVLPGRLDEQVRDRIISEARGNPLALLELPNGLTVTELAGGFAPPDPDALGTRIEESFLRQLRSLPGETQRLLVIAAADPVGDVTLLWRAAAGLGIGAGAAGPAESAGLVEFGARVRFRHPLLRRAAYRARTLPERQAIHAALADATDPVADPDRRAWHLAHAAVGPDEPVAGELERSAVRAQARGGMAAAAAFLERASQLTPDPARRATRALAAARAMLGAGAAEAADRLLTAAAIGPLDELQGAQMARMRAEIVFARNRGSDAPPLLLEAAAHLVSLDAGLARDTYLEAIGAAIFVGRLGRLAVRQAAEAARTAPPRLPTPLPDDGLLDAVARLFTEGYLSGVEPLREALLALRQRRGHSRTGTLHWLWTACPVAPEPLALEVWDDEAWHDLATSSVRVAREAGALTTLPIALSYRAGMHVHAGEFNAASELLEEADAITAATGYPPLRYTHLILAAWRGQEAPAVRMIAACTRDAMARGEGRAIGLIGYVTAVLYNGLGRYPAALAGAQRACDFEDLGFYGWSLVELVESGARSGAGDAAAAALEELERRTRAAGTEWALGVLARSRALLSEGTAADALYREAIDRLARTRIVVHLARTHLLYGEWLRRENRRVDAREQLRTAHTLLGRIGANAFAERALTELRATGETVRKRTAAVWNHLTPQEAQIARLAAEGHTNPEIGSQLFISPRTAEYHLRKVFTKLGIKSRRSLRGALSSLEQLQPLH